MVFEGSISYPLTAKFIFRSCIIRTIPLTLMSSLSAFIPHYSKRQWIAMAIIFVAYIAAAQLGRFLFTAPAVIQPAAGVALTGLVIGGLSLWPAILAAGLVSGLLGTAPLPVMLAGVLAHLMHAVVGAYILKSFGFDPVFRRVRDTMLFIAVALLGSMIVPTVGILGVETYNLLASADVPLRATWVTWWAGIMIGDLILGATLIRYFAKPHFTRKATEVAELILAFAVLGGLTYLVSWTDASRATNGILVILWLLPFIWFSLRLGNRFTFIAFAMTTVIVLTGILYGNTPSEQTVAYRIVSAELFVAVLAFIFFLFTAVVEERKRASKALHAQLNRVGSLLEESKRQDRAKSDFIAVFAHELRNPLAPIVSAIEMLKLQFGGDSRVADTIDILEDRTRTVVRLLDDLLDVSRISQQKFKLRRESVDLRTHVENAVRAMRDVARKHGLALTVSVPRARVCIEADPVRIEQIIGNLLMNAVKYTDRGGDISVALTIEGEEAVIRVRDTGIGIARELLGKIFTPFAGLGVEHRQRTIKEGLGIGLWLTENLVQAHGGAISVESEGAHKGTEFTVRLPLTETYMDESIKPMPAAADNKGSLKILIVDDNEAAANGLGLLLKHVGNTVDFAYVGADVAGKAREFQPDVIVLDIGLPDMTGYEVAEQLRAGGYGGRIIALTGYGQDEDKRKAEAAGFDHHLTKPVGLADLQAALLPQAA